MRPIARPSAGAYKGREMSTPDIEAIESRQREVKVGIDRLQKEADELDIALRVLSRLSPADSESVTKLGPPRPEGVPTIFKMVETVLDEAVGGLTGRQIVEAVGEKYWPGVRGQQILPSVYGFSKQGRLKKTGTGQFISRSKAMERQTVVMERQTVVTSGAPDDEGGSSSSIERDTVRP